MARQKSLQRFTGTMGDVTHYKLNGKFYARAKSTLDRETVLTNKAFANSRKASGQFAKASTSNKLIRTSLFQNIVLTSKTEIHNRMMPDIRKMIKEAESPAYKPCRLNFLPWQELIKFEFNSKRELYDLSPELAGFKITMKPEAGEININIPSWRPSQELLSVKAITHALIIASAAHIDFDKKTVNSKAGDSGYLHLKTYEPREISISLSLNTPVKLPLFISLGIVSYEESNRKMYDLRSRDSKALRIIEVIPASAPVKNRKVSPQKKAPKKKKN